MFVLPLTFSSSGTRAGVRLLVLLGEADVQRDSGEVSLRPPGDISNRYRSHRDCRRNRSARARDPDRSAASSACRLRGRARTSSGADACAFLSKDSLRRTWGELSWAVAVAVIVAAPSPPSEGYPEDAPKGPVVIATCRIRRLGRDGRADGARPFERRPDSR